MTPAQRKELAAQLALVGIHGCGDASCVVLPPQGMATNGGCQCVGGQRTSLEAKRLAMGLAYVLRNYAGNSAPPAPQEAVPPREFGFHTIKLPATHDDHIRQRTAQVMPTVFEGLDTTLADKVAALIAYAIQDAIQNIREHTVFHTAEQLRKDVRTAIEAALQEPR